MFGMMIDHTGPKFYAVPSSAPLFDLKVKVTDLESVTLTIIQIKITL